MTITCAMSSEANSRCEGHERARKKDVYVGEVPTWGRSYLFPIRIYEQRGRWVKVPSVGWRTIAGPIGGRGNFGIELSKAGLVAIDADRHDVDGVAALATLVEGHDWPLHPVVATAGNGEHHIFAQPSPALGQARGSLPAGVDVRGAGGWIVAPGSRRPDGKAWRMIADHPVPMLPKWIEEIIRGKRQIASPIQGISLSGPQVASSIGSSIASSDQLPKALYNKLLAMVPLSETVTRHHQRRARGILGIALWWKERDPGQHRNDGLNVAAYCFRELVAPGGVSRDTAIELLIEVAKLNGYLAKDGIEAALATIASGLGDAGLE
jgi:hypothetical protein